MLNIPGTPAAIATGRIAPTGKSVIRQINILVNYKRDLTFFLNMK